MPDPCPHSIPGENGWCSCYENRPEVCRLFPETYAPFWSKYCKLMRELYKRGEIKKNKAKFDRILMYANKQPKSPFKFFK